jgi:hypothetical protein
MIQKDNVDVREAGRGEREGKKGRERVRGLHSENERDLERREGKRASQLQNKQADW